jgi:hypothetical protein
VNPRCSTRRGVRPTTVMAAPAGLTGDARADWTGLARPTAAPDPFDPGAITGLPAPICRWLGHAITRGAPLCCSVELRMHGEIRLGRWRPFTAVQRLTPAGGFLWAATVRLRGLPVVGFDRYTRGTGEMRWRLANLVPVIASTGEDTSRSAAGRHAGELLVAAPAAALGPQVTWRAVDSRRAIARVRDHWYAHDVTLTVGRSGALAEVAMTRWGDPDNRGPGPHRFGALLDGEARFGDFVIPRRVIAGWHHGTDRWGAGQFIRYTIDEARFG